MTTAGCELEMGDNLRRKKKNVGNVIKPEEQKNQGGDRSLNDVVLAEGLHHVPAKPEPRQPDAKGEKKAAESGITKPHFVMRHNHHNGNKGEKSKKSQKRFSADKFPQRKMKPKADKPPGQQIRDRRHKKEKRDNHDHADGDKPGVQKIAPFFGFKNDIQRALYGTKKNGGDENQHHRAQNPQ